MNLSLQSDEPTGDERNEDAILAINLLHQLDKEAVSLVERPDGLDPSDVKVRG